MGRNKDLTVIWRNLTSDEVIRPPGWNVIDHDKYLTVLDPSWTPRLRVFNRNEVRVIDSAENADVVAPSKKAWGEEVAAQIIALMHRLDGPEESNNDQ
jgi:hypothetical protein